MQQARTGLNRLVQELNRLEQARARIEQGDDKVAVTWGSRGRTVQARTGSCKIRTGGGGHGGESIRLYQARVRTEQVVAWGRIEHTRKCLFIFERESNSLVQEPNRWWWSWRRIEHTRKYLFIFERESNMLVQ